MWRKVKFVGIKRDSPVSAAMFVYQFLELAEHQFLPGLSFLGSQLLLGAVYILYVAYYC